MKAIIIQGMSCLGKTTLAKELSKILPNSRVFSLDTYKEEMWDKYGFTSLSSKEYLSDLAKDDMYKELYLSVKNQMYDYFIFDYPFKGTTWDSLMSVIGGRMEVITILLKPCDLSSHKKAWLERERHPGHNAIYYQDGKAHGNYQNYNRELVDYPVAGRCMIVLVSFEPYKMAYTIEDIKSFCLR